MGLAGQDRISAAGRVLVAALSGLVVANCGSTSKLGGRHPSEVKYGVASSPRVIPEGQPIPKGGGRAMTGKPYVVAGRTYVPREGRGYEREGWASWYGTAFHGRLTANGEIFDRESIAAAHPTLPLPCYVRVTNIVNKRSMIVRVNDRGPYERSRLIDVSERAAEALGFRKHGTGRVRVEYVGKASLDGSDDEKLVASLRTDGAPAALDTKVPSVVLAGLPSGLPAAEAGTSPPTESVGTIRSGRSLPEYAERPKPITRGVATRGAAPSSPRVASGADEDDEAEPLDITPPRRPNR